MYGDITMECHCVSPCMLSTRTHAVSDRTREMMACIQDKFLRLGNRGGGGQCVIFKPEGRKQARWVFSMAQAEGACRSARHYLHCVFLVVIVIVKMATVDNEQVYVYFQP